MGESQFVDDGEGMQARMERQMSLQFFEPQDGRLSIGFVEPNLTDPDPNRKNPHLYRADHQSVTGPLGPVLRFPVDQPG